MIERVEKTSQQHNLPSAVSVEDVNRILEVGKLLLSVLTPEEQAELQKLLDSLPIETILQEQLSASEIGNTGVT